jgi:NTP pyrophosphatase (non-canonical NTP hydrolase)
MIKPSSSLEEFQELNRKIYLITNDRNYSIQEMFSRMHRHITQVLKAVRKEKYGHIEYHLCMSFSWALALLNRLHVDLSDKMWEFFPGFCPYCLSVPCACKERQEERQKMAKKSEEKRPISLREWQQMFAAIYPNTVQNSAMHLAEEAGEVDECIRNHSATHSTDWFDKIIEELVDVVTNIFGVANCRNLDLALGLAGYFVGGCPKCHSSPCGCGYVAIDQPISLGR